MTSAYDNHTRDVQAAINGLDAIMKHVEMVNRMSGEVSLLVFRATGQAPALGSFTGTAADRALSVQAMAPTMARHIRECREALTNYQGVLR